MNVVITGASKGIGKAIAMEYAKQGTMLMLCARNFEELEITKREIEASEPTAIVQTKSADFSKKDDIISFANWCLTFGDIDVLVNNVGSYSPGNVYNEEDGLMEKMMNTNFYSAYHFTRLLLPSMITKKSGHIFNVGSIAAIAAYDGGGSYSISKFALDGFTKNLRKEMQAFGIKVTAVNPGAVYTDSWGNFDNRNARIMESKDIAKMVVACSSLSVQAVVEEILIRPQLGDL